MEDKTLGFTKQQMRIIDMMVFSPFMMFASTKVDSKFYKYGLIFFAITTFAYNYINYQKHNEKVTNSTPSDND